jgi:hypothetical protein
MTASEIITAVKDLFLILAAIVASYVAWEGLSTWRKQLTGTTEYETVRDVLRAAYKLRDRVDWLRAGRISISEEETFDLEKVFQDREDVTELEYEAILRGEALKSRWPAVQEALSEYELASLEAEVLFGSDIRDVLERSKTFVGEIATTIEYYDGFVENKEYTKADEISQKIFGYRWWDVDHRMRMYEPPDPFPIDEVTEPLRHILRDM